MCTTLIPFSVKERDWSAFIFETFNFLSSKRNPEWNLKKRHFFFGSSQLPVTLYMSKYNFFLHNVIQNKLTLRILLFINKCDDIRCQQMNGPLPKQIYPLLDCFQKFFFLNFETEQVRKKFFQVRLELTVPVKMLGKWSIRG